MLTIGFLNQVSNLAHAAFDAPTPAPPPVEAPIARANFLYATTGAALPFRPPPAGGLVVEGVSRSRQLIESVGRSSHNWAGAQIGRTDTSPVDLVQGQWRQPPPPPA